MAGIKAPSGLYRSATEDKALFNAQIYVGEINLDPTVLANQKQLFIRNQDGSTTNISQPVRTGAGGIPLLNGSPIEMFTIGDYSILVQTALGVQISYSPHIDNSSPTITDFSEDLLLLNTAAAWRSAIGAATAVADVPAQLFYAVASGTGDSQAVDFSPNLDVADGTVIVIRSAGINTLATPTVAIDGSPTLWTIVKEGGMPLAIGDISRAGYEMVLVANLAENELELTNPADTVGQIVAFGTTTTPPGWLQADGANVSRTTYAALFAVFGVVHGAGDGSTTFGLPDLRGEFVRGWDDGRGVDSGRNIGSSQADLTESHNHTYSRSITTITTSGLTPGSGVTLLQSGLTGTTTGNTGGSETRPRNVALNYCIKF